MVYKCRIAEFVILRPQSCKGAAEVAFQLMGIFLTDLKGVYHQIKSHRPWKHLGLIHRTVYIHSMNVKIQHLTIEITYNWGRVSWAAHFWGNRKCPWQPSPAQRNVMLFLSLPTYLSNIMVSITQTLAKIKSQECIGCIKQHFMTTSPVSFKNLWNALSKVWCTSTELWPELKMIHGKPDTQKARDLLKEQMVI